MPTNSPRVHKPYPKRSRRIATRALCPDGGSPRAGPESERDRETTDKAETTDASETSPTSPSDYLGPQPSPAEQPGLFMADQLCRGFVAHDQGDYGLAVEHFAAVDRRQFAHLDDSGGAARRAARAYADALFAKDEVEREHGDDPDALATADGWLRVEDHLVRRAEAAGVSALYGPLTTVAWRRHKTGGEYWTPMMHAQTLELRAAIQDRSYPDKPRGGQAGYGPEPVRYALGNELHDMRRWPEARAVMAPYYEFILGAHERANDQRDEGGA